MEVKIFSGIGIIIFGILYITFKRIEIKSEEQIEERMYIRNRIVMLGITDVEYSFINDIFQNMDFLKMHNTGSIPKQEKDIAYKTFDDGKDLSLNQVGDKPQISDEELSPLINTIWKTIDTGIKTMINSSANLKRRKNGKQLFKVEFLKLYRDIADNYMEHADKPLDRHKISAIIISSIITFPLLDLEDKSDSQDEIYFGNYILAIDCGLDYLLDEINEVLRKNNEDELNSFYFPEATACKTPYYRIFFRNLYFADKRDKINCLDIAERLFLLECLTFQKEGVDPELFKEY